MIHIRKLIIGLVVAIAILGSGLLVYTQIDKSFNSQPIIINDVEIKSEVKIKTFPKEPPNDPKIVFP